MHSTYMYLAIDQELLGLTFQTPFGIAAGFAERLEQPFNVHLVCLLPDPWSLDVQRHTFPRRNAGCSMDCTEVLYLLLRDLMPSI